MLQQWSSRAGDATLVGWAIVIAYFAAAALAYDAYRRAGGAAPRERTFWLVAAGIILALGFNKQLDLQTLLTQSLRDMARAGGWYGERRHYQLAFMAVLGAAGAAVLIALLLSFRRSGGAIKGAIAGLALIIAYVLIRAASFHHVDTLFRIEVGAMRIGWLFELSGIAIFALSAWRYRVPKPSGADPC